MMKSGDILSLDIGPGNRTPDSVVTCGRTSSYATETVSSWGQYPEIKISPGFIMQRGEKADQTIMEEKLPVRTGGKLKSDPPPPALGSAGQRR